MNRGVIAICSVAAVYGIMQVTISPLIQSRIDSVAADLAVADKGTGKIVGPIVVRSSDICTMLTQPDTLRGRLSRWAFLGAGEAADALILKYEFTPAVKCSKYTQSNAVFAQPRAE